MPFVAAAAPYLKSLRDYSGLWGLLALVICTAICQRLGVEYVGPHYDRVRTYDSNGRTWQKDIRETGPQVLALFGIRSDSVVITSAGWLWAARACIAGIVVIGVYLMVIWPRTGSRRQSPAQSPETT
jgi:hypothetical protein